MCMFVDVRLSFIYVEEPWIFWRSQAWRFVTVRYGYRLWSLVASRALDIFRARGSVEKSVELSNTWICWVGSLYEKNRVPFRKRGGTLCAVLFRKSFSV